MDATPLEVRLAEGKSEFRSRHAALLHRIAVLAQRIGRLMRQQDGVNREIEDVESRLRLAPAAGEIPPWVEVVVLLVIGVCEWPITYTAAQGFLLSLAMTRLVAVPLAALPPVLGYLLAREHERRSRHEEPEFTALVGVGIGVYTLLTWALRWNYYAEAGAHYFLPEPLMAALLTAVSLLGLVATFVVGSRVDRTGAPALGARKAELERTRAHLSEMLEREQAQLHREQQEYGRLRHDAAVALQASLVGDFPGAKVPGVTEVESMLDGAEGTSGADQPTPAAQAVRSARATVLTNGAYPGAIPEPVEERN